MLLNNYQINKYYSHLYRLLEVIEANRSDVEEPSDEMRRQTEAWLLKLRYDNFLSRPPELM